MTHIDESELEEMVIRALEAQGFKYLEPELQEEERGSLSEVVLKGRLRREVARLNPEIPEEARGDALKQVLGLSSQNLVESNEAFHVMLTEGVPVEYQAEGRIVPDFVRLIDCDRPEANDWLAVNQFTVKRYKSEKSSNPDGTWQHTKITLEPLNPAYQPIPIDPSEAEAMTVLAEFLEVLTSSR